MLINFQQFNITEYASENAEPWCSVGILLVHYEHNLMYISVKNP